MQANRQTNKQKLQYFDSAPLPGMKWHSLIQLCCINMCSTAHQ